MENNKIELIYIDKQNWKHGLHLLNTINRTSNKTHEFIMKRNVVNLYIEKDATTITTKDNLRQAIKKHLEKESLDFITIVDFDLALEEIFKDILEIASEYKIDIKVIEKSKYPIRSNVTVTIDLSVFDITTKYEDIKNIIEDELEKSLNNARKSREPKHSSDLGIDIKYQNSALRELMQTLNEYNLDDIDYLDVDDIDFLDIEDLDDLNADEYEMYDEINDIAEFTNLSDELEKINDIFVSYGKDGDLTIISFLDKIIISKDLNDIAINKKEAKKLMKVLEVMINE